MHTGVFDTMPVCSCLVKLRTINIIMKNLNTFTAICSTVQKTKLTLPQLAHFIKSHFLSLWPTEKGERRRCS